MKPINYKLFYSNEEFVSWQEAHPTFQVFQVSPFPLQVNDMTHNATAFSIEHGVVVLYKET